MAIIASLKLASADDLKTLISKVVISNFSEIATFNYRLPQNENVRTSPTVLMIVPGFNGDGEKFIQSNGWQVFADCRNVILISPTFITDLEEIHSQRGYYYPALWSGKATMGALQQIELKYKVKIGKIYLFGFSAGAHFVHRFANWQPQKVAAFVAYSAGWWDAPVEELPNTPALIMCGEEDERYEPTLTFYQKGRELGCPWVWRSYPHTGHEITPQVVSMVQTFFRT